MRTIDPKVTGGAVSQIVNRVLASNQISRQDHLQLASAVLSIHQVAEDDRRHINRIFDNIQVGRIKVID